MRTKYRRLVSGIAVAGSVASALILGAPAASAGPVATIYPNYSDANCANKGTVTMLQVAATPGGSTNWRPGRWAPVQANTGQRVQITANLYCKTRFGGGYTVVVRSITPKANTSYYF